MPDIVLLLFRMISKDILKATDAVNLYAIIREQFQEIPVDRFQKHFKKSMLPNSVES